MMRAHRLHAGLLEPLDNVLREVDLVGHGERSGVRGSSVRGLLKRSAQHTDLVIGDEHDNASAVWAETRAGRGKSEHGNGTGHTEGATGAG